MLFAPRYLAEILLKLALNINQSNAFCKKWPSINQHLIPSLGLHELLGNPTA
jgi:hypothetical protein